MWCPSTRRAANFCQTVKGICRADRTSSYLALPSLPPSRLYSILLEESSCGAHLQEGQQISAKLLKESAEQIAPAVTLLFQASLHQGCIPSSWKKDIVVPIYKKGSKSSPANYRPISLTAILCKLCEHIDVHCAIIHHLINHKILSNSQHGFRKRRSCEIQFVLTINDLAKGLEDKN